MDVLRSYIGSHGPKRPGQLTERDVAMLIVSAGRNAGFRVQTEFRVPTGIIGTHGKEVRGEIDIVWIDRKPGAQIIVAWEVDGRDAPEAHFTGQKSSRKITAGNRSKFECSGAVHKVQVLYSLTNALSEKRARDKSVVEQWLEGSAVVVLDEALYAPGGIEEWMKIAMVDAA